MLGKKFRILLTKTTMSELIDTVTEGISLLHLKNNGRDSTTSVQKFKILLGQWLVEASGGENDKQVADKSLFEKNMQRDVHVKLEVSKGKRATKVT